MEFYLDTANLADIKKYVTWGVVDGVTTNPSLIAKEGVSQEKRIKEIMKVVDGPISVEVVSSDPDEMLAQGRKYATWGKNIYVKIPATPDGLKVINVLSKEDIRINATLVFSLGQAMLASKAGAAFVSPFIGRLDDISEDGMHLISDIVTVFKQYHYLTKVVVASIRHPRHVLQAALFGADIATMPVEVMDKLIQHPLTDIGLKKFLSDWDKVKKFQG